MKLEYKGECNYFVFNNPQYYDKIETNKANKNIYMYLLFDVVLTMSLLSF